MIVTCTSCLTKFNLDDSKLPTQGAKVRCSRCRHVFYVVPPPNSKEEILEDLESFAKFHEELMEPGEKDVEVSPSKGVGKKRTPLEEEEEEALIFSKKASPKSSEKAKSVTHGEDRSKTKIIKPNEKIERKRKSPSLMFGLLVVLFLLAFGAFYLWTEWGSSGSPVSYFEYPIKKVTDLWKQVFGAEHEGLTVSDLGGYEERIEGIPLYVIEGKVTNQSHFTKKHIKIKVVIFDQNKAKMAEKETLCGRVMGRDVLKNQPLAFFKGEMVIQPKTEGEKVTPSGQSIPFMVAFKDLPSPPKEFIVEILGAPNL